MRIRDGPAAVRGDALPPPCHWPRGREGGGKGSPESEDLPLSRRLDALAEGRRRCTHATSFRPRGVPDRLRARGRPRIDRGRLTEPERRHAVPCHDHRLERAGDDPEAPVPHRLALGDGDRDPVRDRRGQAGDRGRQPVGLPEDRAADESLGLHAERRGDRGLPAGPRRDLVRPEGPLGGARQARHPRRPPGRCRDPARRVSADPPAREDHGSYRRGERPGDRHEAEDHRDRRQGAGEGGRA